MHMLPLKLAFRGSLSIESKCASHYFMNTYEVFSANLEVQSSTVQAIAPILKFNRVRPEMHYPVSISQGYKLKKCVKRRLKISIYICMLDADEEGNTYYIDEAKSVIKLDEEGYGERLGMLKEFESGNLFYKNKLWKIEYFPKK